MLYLREVGTKQKTKKLKKKKNKKKQQKKQNSKQPKAYLDQLPHGFVFLFFLV